MSILTSVFMVLGFIAPGLRAMLLSLVVCVLTAGASVYVGDFWDRKGKVPLINSYNAAIDSTRSMRGHLALLGILWSISFVLEVFI
jgi:hypothetical protein